MNFKPLIKCYGSATVGERGQVVLPIEARKLFKIKQGDTLIVMGTTGGPFKGVSLMKSEEVTKIVEHMFSMGVSMKEEFRDIEKTLKKANAKKKGKK